MSQFALTQKQREAMAMLSGNEIHNMLYGGSRSGKTFCFTRAMMIRAAKEKSSRHVVFREKFNHAKTSLWLDTFPKVQKLCFPNLKIVPSKTDFYLKFPNESELWIAGLDDSTRVEKVLGKEYSTVWFNEVSQINYKSIQVALTRLAEKNNLKKKAYYDMNPPSKSHWSYLQFIKKLNPVDNIPLKKPEIYKHLLMNPKDNAQNIDEGYIDLLGTLPERDRARFEDGDFSETDDGSAYYSFSREKNVRETKVQYGTMFVFMDFNVSPMTAVVGQIVGNELHVHDEVFLEKNSDTYKMCHELKSRGYQGLRVIPDSTGRNRKTSGMSDFKILQEHGFTIEDVFNPFVRDRVTNVNRLFHNLMIIINPKCVKLINDLEKVTWKDGDLFEGQDGMLTHISDALGYGCWKLFPMVGKKQQSTIQL